MVCFLRGWHFAIQTSACVSIRLHLPFHARRGLRLMQAAAAAAANSFLTNVKKWDEMRAFSCVWKVFSLSLSQMGSSKGAPHWSSTDAVCCCCCCCCIHLRKNQLVACVYMLFSFCCWQTNQPTDRPTRDGTENHFFYIIIYVSQSVSLSLSASLRVATHYVCALHIIGYIDGGGGGGTVRRSSV